MTPAPGALLPGHASVPRPGRSALTVALGTVLGLLAAVVLAGPASARGQEVYDADVPDPYVLAHPDPAASAPLLFVYSTNTVVDGTLLNVPVMSTRDWSAFSARTDALPALPTWARPGLTWAPAVAAIGSRHVLYYTVREVASDRQCISRAVSTSGPRGPFTDDSSGPLVCQRQLGGSIDPDVFRDRDGSLYLHYKSDENVLRQPPRLWAAQLSPDGLRIVRRTPTPLLAQTREWERPIVEAPHMVRSGTTYLLLYSGSSYASAAGGVGYARCTGPTGPCTTRSLHRPWLGSDSERTAPTGQHTVRTGGRLRLVHHAWDDIVGYRAGGYRSLWLSEIVVVSGVPRVLR